MDIFRLGLGINVPPHVLNRILALAGGAEVVFVTGSVSRDDDVVRSGEVYAFTDDLAIKATLDSSGFPDSSPGEQDAASVHAEVWRRADLITVTLPAGGGNPDSAWNYTDGNFAQGAHIRLEYRGGQLVEIVAARAQYESQSERLDAFLESLLRDLLD
jgi:hypothetical protein